MTNSRTMYQASRRDGKKLRLIMPPLGLARLGIIAADALGDAAKNHSSAPIGCPPGLWARTWYIHRHAGEQDQRKPQAERRIEPPVRAVWSAY